MELVEFWILNTDGTRRCPLPDYESWDIAPVANDAGALQLHYPTTGINWAILHEGVTLDRDVRIEVAIDGTTRHELRSILSEAQGDDIAEAAVWTYTGTLATGRLAEALVKPKSGMAAADGDSTIEQDGHYYSCTMGTIVATLMVEAQLRGALTDMTYATFTGTHDSNGVAWSQIITLKLTPGTDYLKVLQALVQAGLGEFRVIGNDLRLYEIDTLGTDRTLTLPPLVFREGQTLKDSPRKHSTRGSVTAALVVGADGLYQWIDDADALTRRGRRIEGSVSQGSIRDPDTLTAYGQYYLTGAVSGQMEKTHGIAPGDGPFPIDDFDIHDWSWSELGSGLERLRVKAWTLAGDANGELTATVALNDLIADREDRLAHRLEGIAGGTTITGTSNARQIPDSLIDGIPPSPPTGLSVTSIAYTTDENVTLAAVTVTWDAILLNQDGTALTDLGTYTVFWRYTAAGMAPTNPFLAWTMAATTGELHASFSAVRPGVQIEIRIGATDVAGNFSGWSTTVLHTTANDTSAPPIPSTPLLTAFIGSIRIEWNGLGSLGETMPADFKCVEVHVSTVDNFPPTTATLYDTITGASAVGYTKGAYGVTQFVRFVSVDTSGNRSGASVKASAMPRQILNPDIAAVSIGSAQIIDLDVGKLVTGTLTAIVTLSGDIRTAATGARFGMSSAELYAWNAAGTKTFQVTNAGAVSILGEIKTAASGARMVINPGGTAPAEMRLYPANGTLGKYVSIFTSDIPGGVPGYSLTYIKGDRYTGLGGEAVLRMWYYEAAFGWFDSTADLLSSTESAVYARQYSAGMNGSRLLFVAHGLRDQPVHEFAFTTDSGTQSIGLGQMFKDANDAFILACPAKGSALCWQSNWLYAVSAGNTSTHIGFTASTVTQSSGIETKTNITDIAEDVLALLDGAPAKRWEYRRDHDARPKPKPLHRQRLDKDGKTVTDVIDVQVEETGLPIQRHYGPMAEDLPEGVRVYTPAEPTAPHIDHGSMMGLQWEILRRMHVKIKEQGDALDAIRAQLTKPGRPQ
jgi:hypothetical protein